VRLVISDAHEGLKAAIRRVMGATWQRCRVHWVRNALAYVTKGQQNMVSAGLRQAFIQADRASASQTLRHVADQLRPKWPKLATFIDDSEANVLAHMDFPAQHRSKIHSTDEIDKSFQHDLLFYNSTGDRVAKSRVEDANPAAQPLPSLLVGGTRAPLSRPTRLPAADELFVDMLRLACDLDLVVA
jgi:predicted component of type VI protein secretion system